MNCIIVDDEEMARAIIAQFVITSTDIQCIGEFSSAIDAMKFLNQNQVDLIFLDIHMSNFTGFDFIQSIKNPPHIILVTSDRDFAFEAFEYECIVDYLVKPITESRFIKAIHKVIAIKADESLSKITSQVEEKSNHFYVNIDRRLIKIDNVSVNVIEAKGDYIHIKTDHKNYIVHSTMKKIEDKLPKDLFLKIHRSYIINVTKIIDIEDNSVLIAKDVIPISRSNKTELLKRINVL
ncbi:DNA-binding response regulator [Flavobacterium sp. SOK18b]|uniref:LytR/AlgR family response regulator transcription factor n=1 Tax=Flavobacterium sp. SOK18b TaxID=797900 RepID=UPI0015FBD9F9|nr:LytTR family DNA-binding domain-containing protein [Flavobacterium sp. SOK18b]MBB1192625.1 DNA-binding response regulator [Flavobacterium sp. SOK18b]